MGIFDVFKYNKTERELLEKYSTRLASIGMSPAQAKATAQQLLDKAIQDSKKTGAYNWPLKLGSIVLGDEHTSNNFIQTVAAEIGDKLRQLKREEDVRNDDILWWWNRSDMERQLILAIEEHKHKVVYEEEMKLGNSPELARAEVKIQFPIYRHVDGLTDETGDDRPLPPEMKNRIDMYTRGRLESLDDNFMGEVKKFSSMNAYLRKEIRDGNL